MPTPATLSMDSGLGWGGITSTSASVALGISSASDALFAGSGWGGEEQAHVQAWLKRLPDISYMLQDKLIAS
jgi:hypothetical protein